MKITKNVRLTRRSYRRKLIMFGVSIFMSLALVATGFAAWVLSNDANAKQSGAVELAAVHEESVDISNITFIKDDNSNDREKADQFTFEPLANDKLGRVRYDGTSHPENLDVKFQWTIDNYPIVGEIFVDFKVPATVYTAITNGWLALDMKDGPDDTGFELVGEESMKNGGSTDIEYKVLRYYVQTTQGAINADGSSTDGVVSYTVEKPDDVVSSVTFQMNIKFSWGRVFDGKNPCIYYDTPNSDPTYGANIAYKDVKKTLNEFKATLHGLTLEEDFNIDTFNGLPESDKASLYEASPIPSYYIVINAQVA